MQILLPIANSFLILSESYVISKNLFNIGVTRQFELASGEHRRSAKIMSNKRKRQQLKQHRADKSEQEAKKALRAGLKDGTIIRVDKTKVFSRSVLPMIPDYYRDKWFTCKDCGNDDLWTAKQQQRWYEEQGGKIEAIAVRCRECRSKEKERKVNARKVHLEGLERRMTKLADVAPQSTTR